MHDPDEFEKEPACRQHNLYQQKKQPNWVQKKDRGGDESLFVEEAMTVSLLHMTVSLLQPYYESLFVADESLFVATLPTHLSFNPQIERGIYLSIHLCVPICI